MKTLHLRACAVALALFAAPAFAQGVPTAPLYKNSGGALREGSVDKILCSPDVGATWAPCSALGGGGGSGGTATAASPTYIEGATAQPLSLDLSGRLRTLSTLTGTLPAFASAPTVNLGTLNGAALDATLSTLSAKIPASLGAKSGATSLSVVPNTDTPFPVIPQDMTAITVTPLAATGNLLCATNTAGYPSTSFQITGTFSATLTTEVSNDSTNCTDGTWAVATWFSVGGNGGQINSSPFGSAQFGWILNTHKMTRIRVSAYVSGTVGATAYLRTLLPPFTTVMSLSSGTATVGSTLPTLTTSSVGGAPLATSYILSSAATTNSNLIASSVHRLISGQICNNNASIRQYVKVYNKATAPTVGTDTPLDVFTLQPSSCLALQPMIGDFGQYFSLGIGIGITGAFATSDTTAVAANDVTINLLYL